MSPRHAARIAIFSVPLALAAACDSRKPNANDDLRRRQSSLMDAMDEHAEEATEAPEPAAQSLDADPPADPSADSPADPSAEPRDPPPP